MSHQQCLYSEGIWAAREKALISGRKKTRGPFRLISENAGVAFSHCRFFTGNVAADWIYPIDKADPDSVGSLFSGE